MYDALETRNAEDRERDLFAGFGDRLALAASVLPGLAHHLAGHTLATLTTREDLARLPVLRKSTLMEAQRQSPPYGGFVASDALGGTRVFMSPGPVFEVQRPLPDPWAGARALHAAGLRAGMVVHNAFSYHLTPGGFILDESARAMGCTIFPAGTGNTALQVEAARRFRPHAYVGTPDFLRVLLDAAKSTGESLDSIRIGLVSGGALFPAMREAYRDDGVTVLQCYATADVGVIAYECASDGIVHPGMLVNEDLIVEICRPGTGEPVEAGERGEVVVTRLEPAGRSPVAPLVRFATGDLSAWLDEPSPCGRTGRRLAGWLGRADQRTKVRGMFVDPEQVQAVRSAHPGIERVRLVVARIGGRDVMTLHAQASAGMDAASRLACEQSLARSLEQSCGLGGSVELVDALAADGIVIDDQRDYESESAG